MAAGEHYDAGRATAAYGIVMSENTTAIEQGSCGAADVRRTLSALMPDLSRYWQRPLHAYASVVYDVDPFRADCLERSHAMDRLSNCVERAALRAGFEAEEARSASLQVLASPVLQTGPHCLLLIEPDAFYSHLFSLLGLKAHGRKWHISYCVSTTSFMEAGKKGPGWLQVEGESLNLFGLPRRRMDGRSICCLNGPYRFSLTNPRGEVAPNVSAARLLADLPSDEFPTAAEAIKVANQALWRRKFASPVKLLQLDDFDIADLVADHLEDAQSWMSTSFIGDGVVAKRILNAIDGLNEGPWNGWVRRTTDLFWRMEHDRVVPLRLEKDALKSSGSSRFEVQFRPDDLAEALLMRAILPSLFTVFLVISILPGTRVLGGCRQAIYYPLMRYLASIGFERSGAHGLQEALQKDYRPGLWGHRVLRPVGGDPFQELEHAGGVSPLQAKYAQLSLQEASGDLASFTRDRNWADLPGHINAGMITRESEEWRWSGQW
jgi:hypothetical protein